MTWKELKELIEKMPPEEQEKPVMAWDRDEFPKSVKYLSYSNENIYSNGIDVCLESDFDEYPKELKLVLQKHQYYLSV